VILGIAAIAALLGMMSFTINRLVRRKLRLSLILLIAFVVFDLALAIPGGRFSASPDTLSQMGAFARLAVVAAIINALVVLLINPLREDRVPDRFPTILQDAIVLVLVLLASTFLSQQLLTTSAVSAVVLGFALQDTLGNAFAGLAIQSEKPFKVGQWIKVADFEGRVVEVTWRATKLRTKSGNLVILPNNVVAKEAVTNYSEPSAPVRLEVSVGAAYQASPNLVKAAMLEAVRQSSRVLDAPPPDAHLVAFDASAITYRARFWTEEYERDELVKDQVRTAIYYAFQRHGIEIPWPIQVEYSREWREPDPGEQVEAIDRVLAGLDLFATLAPDLRREVALAARRGTYGDGEAIVRQGEGGASMFIVTSGAVTVVVGETRTEVARIPTGGYFGEMSLLTGEPRTATVLAVGEVEVIELGADLFRRLGTVHPEAIEKIGEAAVARRAGLEAARTAASESTAAEATSLMAQMKRFLRLG
jgi:small-conductance mechanosensitive channel